MDFNAIVLEQFRWEIVQRLDSDSSLSLNKLAKEAKVSVSTLKKICGDAKYKIRIGTVDKLLKYFNIPDLHTLLFATNKDPIYSEYGEIIDHYVHAYQNQDQEELGRQKKRLEVLIKREPQKAEHLMRLIELWLVDEKDEKRIEVLPHTDDASEA